MEYAELHCHSAYSFREGASRVEELLLRARDLGYPALALTDHDNLCGAMEFSRIARDAGVRPVTGAETTMDDGSHLTLLVKDRRGYSNLCELLTLSRMGEGGRREPRLPVESLRDRSDGLILLTGCARGTVPALAAQGRTAEAETHLRGYMDWFGVENVFVELQRNLVEGETARNRRLVRLARDLGVGVVATNAVHYHVPERRRLQDVLVAIGANSTLDATHRERRPNAEFYLKSAEQMTALFPETPDAIANTLRIAERCEFDLKADLGYQLPSHEVPDGHTPLSWLREICESAAERKYGAPVPPNVRDRLDEEFRLIARRDLAGFLLTYYEIIRIAHGVMIDLGMTGREIPIEERPPGRGRGSSVSMLVGYLIGLSHIDPLRYGLRLDRFITDDMEGAPDIDIDFPREIREELIVRVHGRYGWRRAALTGAIATYKMKGCIRDVGKALALPPDSLAKLADRVDQRHAKDLASEMAALPDFRHLADAPAWRNLAELAAELHGFPKYLFQHPGGMIVSSEPLTGMVPVQPSAIEGRYVCHWDKDSVADANFVKIDFLSLGALSQMQQALELVENRTGRFIDLSRIDFDDPEVYAAIHRADTIGIFQIESAAQMQTVTRLKPRNLREMAYEVAAVRPGVGINRGVTEFIARYRHGADWDYDHPLERAALERTRGVILYQDQVNELAVSVAGFSYAEADNLRRAFGRSNNARLLSMYMNKFIDGAAGRGVSEDAARAIFGKFSGQYMFPEAHAVAFGVTAYQMAWVKLHHPLEFYVALFDQQPMGFYNLETLKEDAKRHSISVLNPDVNRSGATSTIRDGESFLIGLAQVNGVGASRAAAIVRERERGGPFDGLADFISRTAAPREAVESLVKAGAFDSMTSDRRAALWETGLLHRPAGVQRALPLPVEADLADLPEMSGYETMLSEYAVMEIHPRSHLMAYLRDRLPSHLTRAEDLEGLEDDSPVVVCGLVVRRQHPAANAIFLTLEDETGHSPVVLWPAVFEKFRFEIRAPVLMVHGRVSRRQGVMNVVANRVRGIRLPHALPPSRSWR